jgi:hypothetical protein
MAVNYQPGMRYFPYVPDAKKLFLFFLRTPGQGHVMGHRNTCSGEKLKPGKQDFRCLLITLLTYK